MSCLSLRLRCLFVTLCVFLASGCSLHSFPTASELATRGGFIRHVFTAPDFDIVGYTRYAPDSALTVYIEGDGRAWLTRNQPSSDPTPGLPLALALAVLDHTPNKVYLARPCQFTAGTPEFRDCTIEDWTSGRMSQAVIRSMDVALNQAKTESGAQHIHLVGYSGGGGIAILLAARRKDVASIRTVAGNLNIDLWTRQHNISPLVHSLHPEDHAGAVRHISQTHYVGAKDTNITETITSSFIKASSGNLSDMQVIPNCTHSTGWEEQWSHLLHEYQQKQCRQKGQCKGDADDFLR